jgi:hypothetical protein
MINILLVTFLACGDEDDTSKQKETVESTEEIIEETE